MNKDGGLVKYAIRGTIIVQLVILIILLIQSVCAKIESEVIPYTELVNTTMPVIQNGLYIDKDMPCCDDGLFVYSQKRSMQKGVYRITVNYMADHEGCYSTVTGKSKGIFDIQVDQTPLQTALNHISYNVYVWSDVDDFSVKYYFGGEGSLIVKDLIVEKTKIYPRLMFCIWLSIFLLIDIILCQIKKYGTLRKVLYEYRSAVVIILWSFFLMYPVWDKRIPLDMDGGFHLLRIEGLVEGFKEGQFPVKMQSNWLYGYGYPVSLYYGDLFLTIPALLRRVGFSVGFSYSVLMFMTHLVTMVTTYWSSLKITRGKRIIALTCAIIYASVPYRLTNMYSRNAVGENLAIAFLPLVVYGIYAVVMDKKSNEEIKKMWIPLVIGFSGIIQSHMLTCVLCAFYVIIVCVINIKRIFQKDRFIVLLKTVVYTSLLNAWFIFPCMLSMKNIDIVQPYRTAIRIQNNGAEWKWMFAYLIPGSHKMKSLGFVVGLVLATYIICWIQEDEYDTRYGKEGIHFWIFTVISVILSTKYFPWDNISNHLGHFSMVISNLQFPTRILGLAAVGGTFCACFTLMMIERKFSARYVTMISVIVILLCGVASDYHMRDIVCYGNMITINDITQLGRSDLNMGEYIYCKETLDDISEYFEKNVNINQILPETYATSEGIMHDAIVQSGSKYDITCQNTYNQSGYIELPILYYDEYQVKDDNGVSIEKECGVNGVMRLILPQQYNGTLHIEYVQPVSWRVCEGISLLFILVMCANIIMKQKKGDCCGKESKKDR